jgi:hypothetical protein
MAAKVLLGQPNVSLQRVASTALRALLVSEAFPPRPVHAAEGAVLAVLENV